MPENKEIEIRYGFIANKEFAEKFLKNAIISEVAYLMPFQGCPSTTSCRFRRRNGKATMTCKTSDGKNANNLERYEDEVEISNEAFEAYTEKLPIMKFYYYKDELNREFKSFTDEKDNLKIIVEKEFDHVPNFSEVKEFADSLLPLGHDLYDMTDDHTVTMMRRYTYFLKENKYIDE